MNVVYVSNENYSGYLGVSLYSLFENNKDILDLKVFIISNKIGEKSKERLTDTGNKFGRNIEIIEFDDIYEKLEFKPDTTRFDISALGRLFVGSLLREDIEKVLYLDCDTVILRSLKKLEDFDFKGKLLAGVPEPTINRQIKADIGIPLDNRYFNSGVLLINLKLWRKIGAEKRVLRYLENIKEISLFSDQDAINGSFTNLFRVLSPKYNFFSNYKYWKYDALIKQSSEYSIITKENFKKSKEHPVIIHFAGDERPWIRGSFNFYKRAYMHYKNKSIWKKERNIKGREIYLFIYHLMNLLTYHFPDLRIFISKIYTRNIRNKKVASERENI